MNYELAKQLKDAGFPEFYQATGVTPAMRGKKWDGLYEPTLSELIEACGSGFWKLEVYGGGAFAGYEDNEEKTPKFYPPKPYGAYTYKQEAFGDTLEEAVASLYIKLHESDKKGETN